MMTAMTQVPVPTTAFADGKMNWTALHQNEDGTTFTATFEMKKVE